MCFHQFENYIFAIFFQYFCNDVAYTFYQLHLQDAMMLQ